MSTAHVSIDLATLCSNARSIVERADQAGLMAVVKADAYGHGAVRVALALRDMGVDFFAVATVDEAVELREAGISNRILVMSSLIPHSLARYERYALDATVGSSFALEAVCGADVPAGLRVHLKIDTGMGRLGLQPPDVRDALRRLRSAVNVDLVSVSTHLASSDADDLAYTKKQLERFNDTLAGETIDDLVVHIANTEGLARVPSAYEPFTNAMVRIGIGLYGCPIRSDSREALNVKPVMTLRALVTNIKTVEAGTPISYNGRWMADRETTIATLGIGYADGYFRSLRGRAMAGVNGTLCRVVGAICMDMIMIDLGPEPGEVAVGDPVTLFGDGGPDVSEIAAWADTITYEITSGLGARVERRYD